MTHIIAHRGASFDAPENTLAAFRLAWEQTADGIEGDFCFTRDRQVVCIHDDDTLRTTGQYFEVRSTDLQQLLSLEVGAWKHPSFDGEPIPTFSQVLRAMPANKWLVAELKTGPEIVELVARELAQTKFDQTRLLIIAFDESTIAESKRALQNVKAHWLVDYQQGQDGKWTPSAIQIAEVVARCGADGIGSQALREVVTPQFVTELRSLSIAEFHLWTVDDPLDAEYYRDLGAWGITTNKPALIRTKLQ